MRRLVRSASVITCLLALQAGSTRALAEPLRAQFFGVSTVQVTDGQTQLMSDGFFSRPSVLSMVTLMQPNEARIDKALAKGGISKLDALLVAHSHHDHALDVGPVARKTGALVVGTPSVGEIAQGQGLNAARTRAVEGGEVLRFGAFEVDVIRSLDEPLKQTIWPLDNIPAALKAINALAAADGVEVRMLQQYQRIELSKSAP